jgi:hypothetical protein
VTFLLFSFAPEVRIFGLMIDAIGIDLFLYLLETQLVIFFIVIFQRWIKPILFKMHLRLGKMDPYYFVPSMRLIKQCPAIMFHAAPFLVSVTFLLVAQVWLFT